MMNKVKELFQLNEIVLLLYLVSTRYFNNEVEHLFILAVILVVF